MIIQNFLTIIFRSFQKIILQNKPFNYNSSALNLSFTFLKKCFHCLMVCLFIVSFSLKGNAELVTSKDLSEEEQEDLGDELLDDTNQSKEVKITVKRIKKSKKNYSKNKKQLKSKLTEAEPNKKSLLNSVKKPNSTKDKANSYFKKNETTVKKSEKKNKDLGAKTLNTKKISSHKIERKNLKKRAPSAVKAKKSIKTKKINSSKKKKAHRNTSNGPPNSNMPKRLIK